MPVCVAKPCHYHLNYKTSALLLSEITSVEHARKMVQHKEPHCQPEQLATALSPSNDAPYPELGHVSLV